MGPKVSGKAAATKKAAKVKERLREQLAEIREDERHMEGPTGLVVTEGKKWRGAEDVWPVMEALREADPADTERVEQAIAVYVEALQARRVARGFGVREARAARAPMQSTARSTLKQKAGEIQRLYRRSKMSALEAIKGEERVMHSFTAQEVAQYFQAPREVDPDFHNLLQGLPQGSDESGRRLVRPITPAEIRDRLRSPN